jgi:hypothetical protein
MWKTSVILCKDQLTAVEEARVNCDRPAENLWIGQRGEGQGHPTR